MNTPLERALQSSRFASVVYDQDDHSIFNVQDCIASGADYLTPEGRQKYNDEMLTKLGKRYLIGRYLEDRSTLLTGNQNIKREGRSIHMGIDLFCKHQEDIHSPAEGEIVYRGCEPAPHGFGHFVVTEHETAGHKWWGLFAHLGDVHHKTGYKLERGEVFAKLGNHEENGGWSLHLHFQLFAKEPDDIFGYVTPDDVNHAKHLCPDPNLVLKLHGLWGYHDDE